MFYRDRYAEYQKKRVGEVEDDRLKFEISTIVFREVVFQIDLNAMDMLVIGLVGGRNYWHMYDSNFILHVRDSN